MGSFNNSFLVLHVILILLSIPGSFRTIMVDCREIRHVRSPSPFVVADEGATGLDLFLRGVAQTADALSSGLQTVLVNSITGDFSPQPLPEISRTDFEQLTLGAPVNEESELSLPIVLPANVSMFPFSAFGKLISTDARDNRYSCSGAYIGHPFVVMTAAHCVHDRTGWRKDVVFAQQFSEGRGIIRRVKKIWIKQAWAAGASPPRQYDYAFLSMQDMTAGGYLGFCFPDTYASSISVGYPVNFGDGQLLEFVQGQLSAANAAVVKMTDNPFLEGSSGGAWITVDQCALGLNSFAYNASSQRNAVYSPRFTLDTHQLWASAVSGVAL